VSDLLYPVFLKLRGRRVVVVGGGPVAAAKAEALLASGAVVTVVAPEVGPEVDRLGAPVLRRAFVPGDLDGAWFAVAAATPEVNRAVGAAAEARQVFVVAVDDPAHCTAYAGAVLSRDGVVVAVSTDGQAPALAGLLREGLDALLPEDLGTWLEVARRQRVRWKAEAVPIAERRPLLLEALNRVYDGRRATAEVKR
jgi:uroporphyrin-III C-methyltransferase/precorrin-2 dehydrogenase/sirohydrochlorin ferrochelatase